MAKQNNYTDVYIDGSEEGGYTVYYTDLNGRKTHSNLDSEDYGSAKYEASHLLGISEEEISDA